MNKLEDQLNYYVFYSVDTKEGQHIKFYGMFNSINAAKKQYDFIDGDAITIFDKDMNLVEFYSPYPSAHGNWIKV